jgi:hypothetical protein
MNELAKTNHTGDGAVLNISVNDVLAKLPVSEIEETIAARRMADSRGILGRHSRK